MRKAKRAQTGSDGVAEEEPVMKKGRNKQVYGVNNTMFYAVDNSKESLNALKLASAMDVYEDREEIFKKHRPALMKLIRFRCNRLGVSSLTWYFYQGQLQEYFQGLLWDIQGS